MCSCMHAVYILPTCNSSREVQAAIHPVGENSTDRNGILAFPGRPDLPFGALVEEEEEEEEGDNDDNDDGY